jgi:hypothetical protein
MIISPGAATKNATISPIWQESNLRPVLPLTRIFLCSKEILVLARNLQGKEIYKEMARKLIQKLKEIARISVTYTTLQVLNQ